jgi:hypothetical protein
MKRNINKIAPFPDNQMNTILLHAWIKVAFGVVFLTSAPFKTGADGIVIIKY